MYQIPPLPGQPPLLPGQPAAPATAPQGYPGPAVPYVPQQPQYAPPQQPAPYSDIGSAIAGATATGGPPFLEDGTHDLEILRTEMRWSQDPTKPRSQLFFAIFKVLQSNNPAHPAGSEATYMEKLGTDPSDQSVAAQGARKRVQDFLVVACGAPSRGDWDAACAAQGQNPDAALAALANAATNATQNPLAGKRVRDVVRTTSKVAGPRSPKAGQQVSYKAHVWAPLA